MDVSERKNPRTKAAARNRNATTERSVLAGPRLDERHQHVRPALPAWKPHSPVDLGACRNRQRLSRLPARDRVAPHISESSLGEVAARSTTRSELFATNRGTPSS